MALRAVYETRGGGRLKRSTKPRRARARGEPAAVELATDYKLIGRLRRSSLGDGDQRLRRSGNDIQKQCWLRRGETRCELENESKLVRVCVCVSDRSDGEKENDCRKRETTGEMTGIQDRWIGKGVEYGKERKG